MALDGAFRLTAGHRPDTSWIVAALVFSVTACVFTLLSATLEPSHDNAWYMIAASRILDGAVPGREIFELNPPLIMYMLVPAAWLVRVTGWDYHLVFTAFIALLCVLSVTLSYVLLERHRLAVRAPLFVGIGILASMFLMQERDLGQRDGLSFILMLPFVLLVACRLLDGQDGPLGFRLVTAAMAAIGIMLKPFFVLLPILFVAIEIVRMRRVSCIWRAEYLFVAALGAGYLALIWIFFREWLGLASIVLDVYSAYDEPRWVYKPILIYDLGLFIFVSLVILLVRSSGRDVRFAGLMMLGALALEAGAILQMKPWVYHFDPYRMCAVTALILAVAAPRASYTAKSALSVAFAQAATVAFLAYSAVTSHYFERPHVDAELKDLLRSIRPGSFMALSSQLRPSFPNVNETGVTWASSFPCQWMAGGILKLSRGSVSQQIRAKELQSLNARLVGLDLERAKPQLVMLDLDDHVFSTFGGDWIAFFSIDPVFKAEWAHYVADRQTEKFRFFRRCDGPTCGPSPFSR